MEKKLTLKVVNGTWMATWSGPEASQIERIMGATTLPTPYLEGYDQATMVREMEARNKGYKVVVDAGA